MYAPGVGIEFAAELIAQEMFFCQHDGLVNKQKQRNKNDQVEQRIDENTYPDKHQDVADVQRIATVCKDAIGNQGVGVHLLIFTTPHDIGQCNRCTADELPQHGNNQPDNQWILVIIGPQGRLAEYRRRRNE